MADRLQESVEIIRHDRDRSRDFLADVSHELRTPLAALRTFNELLKEGAADDPEARTEFLDSSGQQIERLDWLAQNLLELSKLDSGLVLLDLRPDDLRAAVESAVEQSRRPPRRVAASRLTLAPARGTGPDPARPAADRPGRRQPGRPTRSSSRRAAERSRSTWPPTPDGARIEVVDTRRRHRSRRAAPHLRALLPRLARQRGARQRERPRAGDRQVDRRHARRLGRRSRAGSAAGRDSSSPCHATRAWSRGRRPPSRPPSPRRPTGARLAVAPGPAARARPPGNVQETSPTERPQVNPEPAP